ncbi:unnamed protein product, partial [Amoebophrya sp. A120]
SDSSDVSSRANNSDLSDDWFMDDFDLQQSSDDSEAERKRKLTAPEPDDEVVEEFEATQSLGGYVSWARITTPSFALLLSDLYWNPQRLATCKRAEKGPGQMDSDVDKPQFVTEFLMAVLGGDLVYDVGDAVHLVDQFQSKWNRMKAEGDSANCSQGTSVVAAAAVASAVPEVAANTASTSVVPPGGGKKGKNSGGKPAAVAVVDNAQEKAPPTLLTTTCTNDKGAEVVQRLHPAVRNADFDWVQKTTADLKNKEVDALLISVRKKVRDECRLDSIIGEQNLDDDGKAVHPLQRPWRRAAVWIALKQVLHLACVRLYGHEAPYKMLMFALQSFALEKTLQQVQDELRQLQENEGNVLKRIGKKPQEILSDAEFAKRWIEGNVLQDDWNEDKLPFQKDDLFRESETGRRVYMKGRGRGAQASKKKKFFFFGPARRDFTHGYGGDEVEIEVGKNSGKEQINSEQIDSTNAENNFCSPVVDEAIMEDAGRGASSTKFAPYTTSKNDRVLFFCSRRHHTPTPLILTWAPRNYSCDGCRTVKPSSEGYAHCVVCRLDYCQECLSAFYMDKQLPVDRCILKTVSQSALVEATRKLANRWEKIKKYQISTGAAGEKVENKISIGTILLQRAEMVLPQLLAASPYDEIGRRHQLSNNTLAAAKTSLQSICGTALAIVEKTNLWVEKELWSKQSEEVRALACDPTKLKALVPAAGGPSASVDVAHQLPNAKKFLFQLLSREHDPYVDRTAKTVLSLATGKQAAGDESEQIVIENPSVAVPLFFPRFQGPMNSAANVQTYISMLCLASEKRPLREADLIAVLADIDTAVWHLWYSLDQEYNKPTTDINANNFSPAARTTASAVQKNPTQSTTDVRKHLLSTRQKANKKSQRMRDKGEIDEDIVLNEKKLEIDNEFCENLLVLMRKYAEVGMMFHNVLKSNDLLTTNSSFIKAHDVRGKSQVILTCFAIMCYLDKKACKEWPLLLEHSLGQKLWGILQRGEDDDEDLDQKSSNLVPGVPFWKLTERLYLTTKMQKQLLHALEKWLVEREAEALKHSYPPILDGCIFVPKKPMTPPTWTVHEDAFSVRFAERSSEMLECYADLMAECKRRQAEKLAEKREKQAKYEALMDKLETMAGCTCSDAALAAAGKKADKKDDKDKENDDHDLGGGGFFGPSLFGGGPRIQRCERCQLEQQAANLKVEVYARLLPTCGTEYERNEHMAIIFELRQPGLLSCQRDALYEFCRTFCGDPSDKTRKDTIEMGTFSNPNGTENDKLYQWKADEALKKWNRSRVCKIRLASSKQKAICRGTKKYCESLAKGLKKCECNLLHVARHPTFISNHGFNTLATFEGADGEQRPRLKCSVDEWNWVLQRRFWLRCLTQKKYSVNVVSNAVVAGSAAKKDEGGKNKGKKKDDKSDSNQGANKEKNLAEQWLNEWTHDENQVIAQKNAADEAITLNEFEAFGKMRAGVRLQMLRLVKAVAQRSLSFENQDVATLIQSVLWQAGPGYDLDRSSIKQIEKAS